MPLSWRAHRRATPTTLRSLHLRRPSSSRMKAAAPPAAPLAAVLCVALLAASCAAHDTRVPVAPRRLLPAAPPPASTSFTANAATAMAGTAMRRLAGQDIDAKDVFQGLKSIGDSIGEVRPADLSCGRESSNNAVLARDELCFPALPSGWSRSYPNTNARARQVPRRASRERAQRFAHFNCNFQGVV
jgi:hypothetical protein